MNPDRSKIIDDFKQAQKEEKSHMIKVGESYFSVESIVRQAGEDYIFCDGCSDHFLMNDVLKSYLLN